MQSPVMVVVQDKATIEQLRRMNAAIMGNPDSDPLQRTDIDGCTGRSGADNQYPGMEASLWGIL